MSQQSSSRKVALPSGAHRAEDVEIRAVEWLWRDRIPKGAITTVAGKRGQGKGLFAAHLAAEVSRSGRHVVYSAAEDDLGVMTKPRLIAAGANMANITLWEDAPRLPEQHGELAKLVETTNAALIVLDPVSEHCGRGISRHNDSIRLMTAPIDKLARRTGAAVLMIEHTLKRVKAKDDPLNAIGGGGLPGASRMAYLYGRDPEDADRSVLANVKSNLREDPDPVAFEMDVTELDIVGEIPSLVYDGECIMDPIRLVASDGGDGEGKPGRRPEKRAAAAEWLVKYLAASGEPVLSKQIQEDAKQHNLPSRTLRRAADELGVIRDPSTGGPKCTWALPDEVKQALAMGAQMDANDQDEDEDDGGLV